MCSTGTWLAAGTSRASWARSWVGCCWFFFFWAGPLCLWRTSPADPVADKLMVVSASAAMAWSGGAAAPHFPLRACSPHAVLPWPLVSLFVLRDVTLLQGKPVVPRTAMSHKPKKGGMWHRYRSLPLPKSLHAFFAVSPTGMQVTASPLSKVCACLAFVDSPPLQINTMLQVGLIGVAIASGAVAPDVASAWYLPFGALLLQPTPPTHPRTQEGRALPLCCAARCIHYLAVWPSVLLAEPVPGPRLCGGVARR